MKLDGQQIAIVGGSTGIGLATARLALREGAAGVLIVGRTPEKLRAAEGELAAPGRVRAAVADVADAEAIRRAFATLSAVDHVYVSAGTLSAGPVATTDPAQYARGVDERIWGYLGVVRAAVPIMRPTGSLTFTSGLLSQRPAAGTAITTMLASAVEGLVRALPLEVAPIRVNALVPGMIDTPLLGGLFGDRKAALLEADAARSPIGRSGTAEEAAEAVLFLMTNGFMNGESLYQHGGVRFV